MRWQGRRQSVNVEDRRRGRRLGGRSVGLGCGGLVVVLLLSYLLGADPVALLEVLGEMDAGPPAAQIGGPDGVGDPPSSPPDELGRFAAVVLADTEDTWRAALPRLGRRYEEPTLVLFSDAVASACGFNTAAVGPFYCPADRRVYLDLAFFDELERRFGAPGDFAQAYVIAHEVGHHVQNLLGISAQVERQRRRASTVDANALSVDLELQADCLAGVWGHEAQARGLLEPGDLEEGLNAAAAIGDDRMQRRARGYVVPESFTHGSSEQRVGWFSRGLEHGDPGACEIFGER
jgi:hypothetical protein